MKYSMYDRRQAVFELQTMLRANHLLEGGILIHPDGIFDIATEDALRLFQKQNGLTITGIADYPTWLLLSETAYALCQEVPCILG